MQQMKRDACTAWAEHFQIPCTFNRGCSCTGSGWDGVHSALLCTGSWKGVDNTVTTRGDSKGWSGNPNCCLVQVFWIAPWKYPPFFTDCREPNCWGQAPKVKGCDFFHLFLIATHCDKYYSEQVTENFSGCTADVRTRFLIRMVKPQWKAFL